METASNYGGQEILGAARVEGPIVVVEGMRGVGYDEVVEIIDARGRTAPGARPGGWRGSRRGRGLRRDDGTLD